MLLDWLSSRIASFASELREAMRLLTAIPMKEDAATGAGRSPRLWPLAGGLLGLVAGALAEALHALGANPSIAALAGLVALIALTGALHEDGLADAADGLASGASRERRLEIMRDSRIGAFGCIALVAVLLGRLAGMSEIAEAGNLIGPMIAVGAVSRGAMLASMSALPAARDDGLAASFGRPSGTVAVQGCAIAAIIAFLAMGISALPILALAALAAFCTGLAARRRIGGHTGDTLGATQQTAELACLSWLASTA